MDNKEITVAIFGDCATQMAVEKYKHTRSVGLTNWLSIVSPTTSNFQRLTREKIDNISLTNYEKRICLLDANKEFLDYLLGEKADYLILDCNDCRKQLIFDEFSSNEKLACITDNSFMLAFNECVNTIFESSPKRYVPSTSIDRKVFDNAVEKICNEIKKVYKPSQIIINKHYYADVCIDDMGAHRYPMDLVDYNERTLDLIKYVESLVEKQLEGCHIIEFPDDVFGASKHRFGVGHLHYIDLYYEYVREALEIIFHESSEEKFYLKWLQRNYSAQFKILKLEMLEKVKSNILEKRMDDVVNLCIRGALPVKTENIAEILRSHNDVCGYLDALYMLQDELIILVATKDTSGFYEDSIVLRKLKRLGFDKVPSKLWFMYVGITFRGKTLVDVSSDKVEEFVKIEQRIGEMRILMKSEAFRKGNQAVISIDDNDYAQNRRGINIVVCSARDGRILDSISYDSHVMDYFYRG